MGAPATRGLFVDGAVLAKIKRLPGLERVALTANGRRNGCDAWGSHLHMLGAAGEGGAASRRSPVARVKCRGV